MMRFEKKLKRNEGCEGVKIKGDKLLLIKKDRNKGALPFSNMRDSPM